MIRLAIVIPFYKLEYFEETLRSISNQTDKRFKLYIGDDNSPESPVSLLNQIFVHKENVFYKHFKTNLGSSSLTRHWERCINLSNEEYIWLFSDDDLMPDDAVERFYKSVDVSKQVDLFRFNIQIIDKSNVQLHPVSEHPLHESAESFLKRRLNGTVISTACEYIFSRKEFLNNGFVEFPLAWASDDATWLNYADKNGMFLIPGKCVSWRMSGDNISSTISNYKKKAAASVAFIKLISPKYKIDNRLKLKWLTGQIDLLGKNRKMKKYFWWHILIKNTFPLGFVIISHKHIIKNLLQK